MSNGRPERMVGTIRGVIQKTVLLQPEESSRAFVSVLSQLRLEYFAIFTSCASYSDSLPDQALNVLLERWKKTFVEVYTKSCDVNNYNLSN